MMISIITERKQGGETHIESREVAMGKWTGTFLFFLVLWLLLDIPFLVSLSDQKGCDPSACFICSLQPGNEGDRASQKDLKRGGRKAPPGGGAQACIRASRDQVSMNCR